MPNIVSDVHRIGSRGTGSILFKVNNTTVVTCTSTAITFAQPITTAYLYVTGTSGTTGGNLTLSPGTGYGTVVLDITQSSPRISSLATGKAVQVVTSDGTTQITGAGLVSESWIAPTLLNSWVRYTDTSFQPPGYYRDKAGIVHLRGLIGGGAVGSTIMTLPANYRPQYRNVHFTQCNGGDARIDIDNLGNVILVGASLTGYLSLDGIAFRSTYL